MTTATRSQFELRPHNAVGSWLTEVTRHTKSARQLLLELEVICAKVIREWPVPRDEPLRNAEDDHPNLFALVEKRDRICDSVRIFAAISVESFLNYYGVVRLGETEFNSHFERMGLVPKLRVLLLVCDSLSVPANDPIVVILNELAKGRNALAHPKTTETEGYVPAEHRPGVLVPEAGREAVENMNKFFREFVLLVPASHKLVPSE